MVATAAGVPFAMLFDQYFGWRSSFWAVVILVFIATILMQHCIPTLDSEKQISLKKEIEPYKKYELWAVYTTSLLIIGATFAAFSYFTPILSNLTGFDSKIIPFILSIYGIATIIGNVIVGRLADAHTLPILIIGLIVLTIALIIFGLFVKTPLVAVSSVIVVGLVGVTLNPAMETRVTKVAGTGTLVATAHNSAINLGLLIGSAVGGLAIDIGYGLKSPLWVGAILAVLGLISLLPFLRGKVPNTNIH